MATDQTRLSESPGLAGLRFALEVAAWLAIYAAWGWIALVLAIAALSLFTVPGDKHVVLVRIPGPLRVALEVAVLSLGTIAAWLTRGAGWGAALLAASLLLLALSRRRLAWLWGR